MNFEQAAVVTLQNSVGCFASEGVSNFQFYFPDASEQLTEEELEKLLHDEQIQQDAGVGNFQFYFPDLSEQLTDEEIEKLLLDEQTQQEAGVGICSFCEKFEYLVDLYESALSYGNSMCTECGGGY